jgi:hypothetical protein
VCFFGDFTNTRYTLCARYTLCDVEHLHVVAKSQLHNEFSQNIFPTTPHGNGNIGSDSRQLPEFGFNVGEISPPPQ